MKESKSSFRDKMKRHLTTKREREERKSFSYLNLPKGVKQLVVDEDVRKIKVDFLMYKVTDNRHPDRELPDIAIEGSPWWRRPFKVHRDVGSLNETVICPISIGKKCPICDYRTKLIKGGADKEEFKVFYPKPRCLYLGVLLAIKKAGSEDWEEVEEEEVLIWDMSTKLFQEILDETLEEDSENSDFPLFEGGKTAILTIKWDKIGKNSYPEVRHIEFEKRDDYDSSLIDEIPCLDEVLSVLPYEEIESKFFEIEDDGGELKEVDDDEPPKKPAGGKSLRKSPRREEAEEVEEAEETAPKDPPVERKKKSLSLKKNDNDDAPKKIPAKTTSKSGKGKCEFGHTFGMDALEFPECENECSIWSECVKEKERNES